MSGPGYSVENLKTILGENVCEAITNSPAIAEAVKTLVTKMNAGSVSVDMSDASFSGRQSSGISSPSQEFLKLCADDLLDISQRMVIDTYSRKSILIMTGIKDNSEVAEKLLKIHGQSEFFRELLTQAQSFDVEQLKKFLGALKSHVLNRKDTLKLDQLIALFTRDQQ